MAVLTPPPSLTATTSGARRPSRSWRSPVSTARWKAPSAARVSAAETVAEVAEARPDLRVRIVGSPVAGTFSHRAHQRVRAGLERLRAEIVDDGVTKTVDGAVHLRSGTVLASVDTLARLIAGRAPRPYAPRYVARAVTLGRRNAVGQFTRADDTLRKAGVAGRTAVVIKELASRGGKFGARTGTGA
ncbi:hypothetical protein [Kitasatospora sp. NPDC047058]|uniref:hypothetical protein n=1 Tax=Kitasatospora sp. NPDC047058 TaxID=3155620 RepID=UPI0033E29D38